MYAFRNERPVQPERLRLLQRCWTRVPSGCLRGSACSPGGAVLEVGAGGGWIRPARLCDRTAPNGSVLATDLDTTVLGELQCPNL